MDNSIWEDSQTLKDIKKIFGVDLSDTEFQTFCGIGKSTGLNPFLREIWAVKYGNTKANIFIGRDGHRKSAQKQKDYDYHQVDAVYENDEFNIVNGEIQHKYNLKDRGGISGAYAICQKKGSSKPIYKFIDFKEYYIGHKDENGKIKKKQDFKTKSWYEMKPTLWDTKPKTMIEKVAEAQVLRMTFQNVFGGTYDETEQWEEIKKPIKNPIVSDTNFPMKNNQTNTKEQETKTTDIKQSETTTIDNQYTENCTDCNTKISQKIASFSMNIFKKKLCMECQKKVNNK